MSYAWGCVHRPQQSNLRTGLSSCHPRRWVWSPFSRQCLGYMFGDIVVSPCLLRDSLIVKKYRNSLHTVLPGLLEGRGRALRNSSTRVKTPAMVECDVSGQLKRTWRAVSLLDCLHVLPWFSMCDQFIISELHALFMIWTSRCLDWAMIPQLKTDQPVTQLACVPRARTTCE